MPFKLPKTVLGILSKTFFCHAGSFFLRCSSVTSPFELLTANGEPKKRKTKILKTLSICWHTVGIYCVPVCLFFSTCVSVYQLLRRRLYRRHCSAVSTFSSKLAVCVYHDSTMLLLSQLASASGGLFSVWDCVAHPTHPEGI